MSIADYNSFGIIPSTDKGHVAVIESDAIVIDTQQDGEYIRVHTKVGDSFTIVHADTMPSIGIYPFIITKEDGTITFYGSADKATNYTIDITQDKIGGQSGYIYFNSVKSSADRTPLMVYQNTNRSGLLHQAVQNELIMLIQKQLKEMSE